MAQRPRCLADYQLPSSDLVWIVGGGTSLAGFDFDRLRGETVIVLNDTIRQMPWATCHLYLDGISSRYKDIRQGGAVVLGKQRCYQRELAKGSEVYLCQTTTAPSESANSLYKYATVMASGIHLAARMARYLVVLLGFDCYVTTAGTRYHDGRKHNEGRKKKYKSLYPAEEKDPPEIHMLRWIEAAWIMKRFLDVSNPHLRVVNASPRSRCNAFPRISYESAFTLSSYLKVHAPEPSLCAPLDSQQQAQT